MAKKFTFDNLGSVLKMIGLMKANPEKAGELLADIPDDIMESIKAQSAMGFEGTKEVKDLWQTGEFHRNPTTAEIPVGPQQAARGGNVHRQEREYSDFERQRGLMEQEINFQATLSMMGESMKALATGIQFLVAKAAEDKEEDKMAEEDAEKAESDAKKSIEKAQTLIGRAADLRDDADCETGPARKALIVKAKNLRTNAGHELAKAQLNARALVSVKAKAAAGGTLLGTIKAIAEKANVTIKAKEDEEEEVEVEVHETEKSESEKEAEKAASMQEKAPSEKSGAETDAAKAAAEPAEKAASAAAAAPDLTKSIADLTAMLTANNDAITKALSGQRVLEGNIHTLMDAMAGKPLAVGTSVASAAPDLAALMKSNPAGTIEKLNDAVATAIDSGRLDGSSGPAATSLLGSLDAVQHGAMDMSIFESKLANAPAAVRTVFAEAGMIAA